MHAYFPLTLSMVCRTAVTIMCRGMVFWRYPLDHHICIFRLSSCEFSTEEIKFRMKCEIIFIADGYGVSQIKIFGQLSYQISSQRDLQFQTDIREIDLSRRVWHGEESEWGVVFVNFMALCCRELQHLWSGDFVAKIIHSLPCYGLYSIWFSGHHRMGNRCAGRYLVKCRYLGIFPPSCRYLQA